MNSFMQKIKNSEFSHGTITIATGSKNREERCIIHGGKWNKVEKVKKNTYVIQGAFSFFN